jgi:hypothetical protein
VILLGAGLLFVGPGLTGWLILLKLGDGTKNSKEVKRLISILENNLSEDYIKTDKAAVEDLKDKAKNTNVTDGGASL